VNEWLMSESAGAPGEVSAKMGWAVKAYYNDGVFVQDLNPASLVVCQHTGLYLRLSAQMNKELRCNLISEKAELSQKGCLTSVLLRLAALQKICHRADR